MFAPKLRVKGKDGREVPVQEFLQGAFLDMWEVVARKLGDLESVLGFEVSLVVNVLCKLGLTRQRL